MSNPLDNPATKAAILGSPEVRAEDRERAAKAALRQAKHALDHGQPATAVEHLEFALDRLRRALAIRAEGEAEVSDGAQ